MFARIFQTPVPLFILIAGGAALLIGLVVGALKGREGPNALLGGVEAATTAVAGALLARAFVSVLLGLAHDSGPARLCVGWGLFLWPGAIDTVPTLFLHKPLFTVDAYLWIATCVGAFAGMMDGLFRIHDWTGLGVFGFIADLTWGLAGTTNGCLFHLFNTIGFVPHGFDGNEARKGAHRYAGGFHIKPGFAVTQGSVMSSMDGSDTLSNLFAHERTHVFQNRIAGPLFTLTYLGWMPVWLIPGLIMGGTDGIMWFSYYNNPWEVWAYHNGGWRDPAHKFCWGDGTAISWAIPFFLLVFAAATFIAVKVWL